MISEGLLVFGACVIDRVFLKRAAIRNVRLGDHIVKRGGFIGFPLSFFVQGRLRNAKVSYELRDVKRPTTVIKGESRSLGFSYRGSNEEYLYINESLINESGDWRLSVKIIISDSFINPLYKLFPIEISVARLFNI